MRLWFTAAMIAVAGGSASAGGFDIDPAKYPKSGISAYFAKEVVDENAEASAKSLQETNQLLAAIGLQPLKTEAIDNCYLGFTVTDARGVARLYTLYMSPLDRGPDESFPSYRLFEQDVCSYDAASLTETCKTDTGQIFWIHHPNGYPAKTIIATSKAELDQQISAGTAAKTMTMQSCDAVKDDLAARVSGEKATEPPNPKWFGGLAAVARQFARDPAFKAAFIKALRKN